MAPTRPSKKKAKAKDKAKRAALAARNGQAGAADPKQLMAEATVKMEQGDASAAARLAGMACDSLGESGVRAAAALTLLGEARIEMGEADGARECFLGAVRAAEGTEGGADADPEAGGGAEKFLWLAQLSEEGGKDSVSWYERGAVVLRAQIRQLEEALERSRQRRGGQRPGGGGDEEEGEEEDEVVAEVHVAVEERRRRLGETLCAVAEVYMTDLSWEEDAERRCEALVTEAGILAPDHAETWQTLANVRISQSRTADARAALERSLALWSGLSPGDPAVPPFPTRIGLARLLIEVGMDEAAIEVAERLLQEDDESVESWYLDGYALYCLGQRQKEQEASGPATATVTAAGDDNSLDGGSWKASWKSARQRLTQCLSHFETQDYEDERLGEHAQELIGSIIKEIGGATEDEDDDEDDGWEDTDGDQDGDQEMQ